MHGDHTHDHDHDHDHAHDHGHHPYPHAEHPLGPSTLRARRVDSKTDAPES
jgi:sirohydrochlorin cobaltochelatase